MKSIRRKFELVKARHPYWSSYICFADTITKANLSKKAISYWFNKLVEKDDYLQSEKKGILDHLFNLSKVPEDGIKQPTNAP